ncbi:hypothetical protein CAPTEDRAFT_210957, partial [Capitella teleta]
KEQHTCLDALKDLKRRAALDNQELIHLRETESKQEEGLEELEKQVDYFKQMSQHSDFIAKGAQLIVSEMEEKEIDQEKLLKEQAETIQKAHAGAAKYRLYFGFALITLMIICTINAYNCFSSKIVEILNPPKETTKKLKRK